MSEDLTCSRRYVHFQSAAIRRAWDVRAAEDARLWSLARLSEGAGGGVSRIEVFDLLRAACGVIPAYIVGDMWLTSRPHMWKVSLCSGSTRPAYQRKH